MSLMWMPPQTTAPPLRTDASACGTGAPTGAKIRAASSASGAAPVESCAEAAPSARKLRRRAVAGPHKSVDASSFPDRDLRDDMRGGAKTVDPDRSRRARHAQRAPSNQAGAEKRGQQRGIAVIWQRETKGRVRNDMGRVAAIARVAGEKRIVAEIFAAFRTIGTMAAGMAEPWHADTRARRKTCNMRADRFNASNDLMPRHDRTKRMRQLAVDYVEIRPADASGFGSHEDFFGAGQGFGSRLPDERGPRRVERHRRHGAGRRRQDVGSGLNRRIRKIRAAPGGKSSIAPMRRKPCFSYHAATGLSNVST